MPKKKSRIIMLVSFGVLVSIGALVFISPVSADVSFDDIPNGIIKVITEILLAIAQLFIRMTIFLLQFFILIAGYNNYINAPVVELGWNMVRDLTNMFFVVALLAIAFGTILGIESYEWRRLLPKLLGAALLVNFSNLICQLIIDVSQVFMTTFLNAIAGAAGGNLIQMFNFQEIFKISTSGSNIAAGNGSDLRIDVFISGVIAITFAGMAMMTIMAYTVIVLVRMVVLWALIVLSPLGFVFAALPATQKYAKEYWEEFTNYVIVGPIMVFFLWLAFASFGGGGVVGEHIEQNHKIEGSKISGRTDQTGNSVTLGLSEAASYDNIANFLVALAFLYIGLERVQKLNVKGSGMVGSAMNFGKNVATIASGVAAGRWLTNKVKDEAVEFGKDHGKLAWNATGGRLRRMRGIEKIPFLGAGGKLRTKAALEKQEKLLSDRDMEIKKKGGGLLAEGLSPSKSALGRQAIRTAAAVDMSEAKTKAAEVAARQAMYGSSGGGKTLREIDRLKQENAHQEKESARTEGIDSAGIQRDIANRELGELLTQRDTYEERYAEEKKTRMDKAIQDKLHDNPSMAYDDAEKEVRADKNLKVAAQNAAMDGLSHYEAFRAAGKAGQKEGKFGSETTRITAAVKDSLRLGENKDEKQTLEWEEGQYTEEMGEYGRKTMDELFAEVKRNHAMVQKLNAIPEGDRTKAQDTDMKNAKQGQMRAVSSAMEQGWGNMLYGDMASLDKSFEGMDYNDPENMDKIMLGLTQGVSKDDLDTPDKIAEQQEALRKGLKEKAGVLFRIAMNASEKAANEHGQTQFGALISEGINESGDGVLALRGGMVSGVGRKNRVGTGTDDNGMVGRKKYQAGALQPSVTIRSSKDGRAFMKMKKVSDGKGGFTDEANGFVSAAHEKALLSIGGMSENDIKSMEQPIYNFLSGGTFEKNGYDGTNIQAGAMKGALTNIHKQFEERLNRAVSSKNKQEETRVENAMRQHYIKIMGESAKSLTQAQLVAMQHRIK